MVYNEQCKFTSALITLNTAELKSFLNQQGLPASFDTASDAEIDKIIHFIREDLTAFTKNADYSGIPAQWKPASFAIIPGVFDERNGLVNSTMKLVRHNVSDYYTSGIDEIYASGSADPCIPGNRRALREIFSENG